MGYREYMFQLFDENLVFMEGKVYTVELAQDTH